MSFEVDDIDCEISDLEGHGVSFEDYDLPDLKTVDHVFRMSDAACAWFKGTPRATSSACTSRWASRTERHPPFCG
jgi:hypothetical protein